MLPRETLSRQVRIARDLHTNKSHRNQYFPLNSQHGAHRCTGRPPIQMGSLGSGYLSPTHIPRKHGIHCNPCYCIQGHTVYSLSICPLLLPYECQLSPCRRCRRSSGAYPRLRRTLHKSRPNRISHQQRRGGEHERP